MNRSFKLMILSLLGFSAACSGAKNSAKSEPAPAGDTVIVNPRIHVMYGVRRPVRIEAPDSVVSSVEIVRGDVVDTVRMSAPGHVVMYGVRVPLQNIDLDSLKQAQARLEAVREGEDTKE
ncbi:MAG: hypothetical protein J1D86_05710 [Alistipes sp.]|nr:hypothetical protein [Alistipes sp.]